MQGIETCSMSMISVTNLGRTRFVAESSQTSQTHPGTILTGDF